MTLRQIVRYPVKGLPAIPLDVVELAAGEQLPGDRRFAFWRGDDPPAGGRSPHQRRFNFRQVADDNALAALRATSSAPARIAVRAPDGSDLSVDLETEAGKAALAEWIGAYLGIPTPTLLESIGGQGFTDIGDKTLSLINLNSVADLSERAGQTIEPMRMRGNLYVDMPAWSELDMVGQELRIGDVVFEVDSRIKRCVATEVNYGTGRKDHPTPQTLMKAFGHADCGVYLRVRQGGRLKLGDPVG
ncbi:MAG: MOSC domain-containing protein [Alphaproteobacteria bacterium]|nr:MOSC domain-containing protein [Alphaproteobacteria bacterium]